MGLVPHLPDTFLDSSTKVFMHYFQFEIKEWLANTAHLSECEEAYYLRLILYYYDSEQVIPLDPTPVFRKLRIKDKDIGMQILNEFFILIDIGWEHNRCNQEINKYQAKIEQASKAGKASAEKRFNARSTPVQLIKNHKSLIINHNKNLAPPDGVDISIWNDFLILRKAKKLPVTQTAINGLIKEGKKANLNLLEVLKTCCERGWGGFKAEWVKDKQTTHDRNMQTLSALTGGIHGNDFSFKSIKDHTINSITIIDELPNDKLL